MLHNVLLNVLHHQMCSHQGCELWGKVKSKKSVPWGAALQPLTPLLL